LSLWVGKEIQTMPWKIVLEHSSFATARRCFRTRMVTYLLYAHILRALAP